MFLNGKKRFGFALFLYNFICLLTPSSWAYLPIEVVRIKEDTASITSDVSPLNTLLMWRESSQPQTLFLLNWVYQSENITPKKPYNRHNHFGRWINDPDDNTCFNTRAKVLIRDSSQPVTFRQPRRCTVESGRWWDSYTANEWQSSQQIQIDHMVPLKNAYISGAWKWNYKTRCLFANYLGNNSHLIPVSGTENMRKGDRSPADYLPENKQFRCQYIRDWLSIKLIWRLALSPKEAQAIQNIIASHNCPADMFLVTQTELQNQREYIQNNINYCAHLHRDTLPIVPIE